MSLYETMIVVGMALWVLVAATILFLLVRVARLLGSARRPLHQVAETLEGLEQRTSPLLRHAERAAEDLNYLAGSLRADAERMGGAMRRVADSTERMVNMVEERVADITGLLEVVQEEAEETFLTTASLLRGWRKGRERAERKRRWRALRGGS